MLRHEEAMKQANGLTVRSGAVGAANQFSGRQEARPDGGNVGGIMEYWNLLKRRKLLVLVCGILGALAAFGTLVYQQPVYGAGTTLEVQGFNESFMGMNNVDPQANTGNYAVNSANINTQLRIIESGSIRAAVVDRLRRETAPVSPPVGGTLGGLRKQLRHSREDPLIEMRRGLGMAVGTLHAKAVLGTRIIAITCDSTIPEIASTFVNTVAAEYIAQNAQQRSINYQKTAQWLETQVEETKIKLEQAESNLQEFTRQSGGTFIGGEKETLASSKLRALQADLAGIQNDRIAKQEKYDQVKASPPDTLPDVIENQAFRALQAKLAEQKQDLAKLSLTLMPANPKVQRAQQQIEETMAAMQKEKELTLQRIRNDYESAMRRERMLSSAYTGEAGAVTSQSSKAAQYAQLSREVDLYRQTLNNMLTQVNQIAVVSAVPANNVRVIDGAIPSNLPYKPDATNYEIYGLLMGCAAGVAVSLAIETFSKWRTSLTFAAPGYAPRLLNVPELGVIPSALIDLSPQKKSSTWMRKGLTLSKREAVSPPKAVELEISKRQGSFLAESFRLTLTSILLMARRGLQPKVIVVTSPNPGEGKTTVVSNMAIAIAESGRKVLIIDADLRRPQLHAIFGVDKTQGFGDLIGRTRGNGFEKPSATVCESQIPGVFLVPSGSTELINLSQVFHSVEIPVLLKKLAEDFDVILIDTPPMLQFSDARLMARFADGVILVVRSGLTACDSAVVAREQLAQDNIDLLGTILNDWDARGSRQKNGYHSYYDAFVQYQKKAAQV